MSIIIREFHLPISFHHSTKVGRFVGNMFKIGILKLSKNVYGAVNREFLKGVQGSLIQIRDSEFIAFIHQI